jgi:hypothetical protein
MARHQISFPGTETQQYKTWEERATVLFKYLRPVVPSDPSLFSRLGSAQPASNPIESGLQGKGAPHTMMFSWRLPKRRGIVSSVARWFNYFKRAGMAANTLPNQVQDAQTHSEDGVDLTLIQWMLAMTPAERLQTLQRTVQSIQRLRHAARGNRLSCHSSEPG